MPQPKDPRVCPKLYQITGKLDELIEKTSMMWPSQNFLLCNRNIIKMKVTEWKTNLRKYVNPPPFGIYTTCTNYNNLISKKSKRF